MPLDKKLLEDFITEHPSQYVGKYRFHSGYRTDENVFKSRYYMLDQSFRQIDIYVELNCKDSITYVFSEALHEQEQLYIIKDLIRYILAQFDFKRLLHYSLYENYIKMASQELYILEPIDFCDILNYMKYHHGINQKTMDQFYEIFIPHLKIQLKNKNYKKFIDSVNLLYHYVLYEYAWDGTSLKYLDTEYQFHLYYIREIIRLVYHHLDKFYETVPDELYDSVKTLCLNTRFSFAIMTDFGSLILSQYHVTLALLDHLKRDLVLNDKDQEKENVNLVFSYIYYIFHNDYDQYYAVVLKVLRMVINNMLSLANSDLDLALGNSLVQSEGYQIILDLFHEDYNTFIFSCFPIASFPQQMRPNVRDELATAVQFFAARMENDSYRLSSFEQVMNINRLLMDNFKEWYK